MPENNSERPDRPRRASIWDYIRRQGGKPQVSQDEGGLWHINHAYDPEDPIDVTTHISPKDRGTVIIDGVEYDVANLREFEGDPCERQSKKIGGKGYNRKKRK